MQMLQDFLSSLWLMVKILACIWTIIFLIDLIIKGTLRPFEEKKLDNDFMRILNELNKKNKK